MQKTPKCEDSFAFLTRVDVAISGDSSILLEAVLMDVYPIYYDFSLHRLDYYSFLHNGLVEYASEPDEVCSILEKLSKSKPSVRSRAKLYCCTVDTPFEGHSSDLAAQIISGIALGTCGNMDPWIRITGLEHLEAYELVDYSNPKKDLRDQ